MHAASITPFRFGCALAGAILATSNLSAAVHLPGDLRIDNVDFERHVMGVLGKMGSAGAVGYLFERKGLISVDTASTDEDTLMAIALDAGADDLRRSGNTFEITSDPAVFAQVQEAIQKKGLKPVVAEISQLPKVPVDVDAETGKKVLRLMEALDDHDDVQNVYSNVNISEEMVAEVGKG